MKRFQFARPLVGALIAALFTSTCTPPAPLASHTAPVIAATATAPAPSPTETPAYTWLKVGDTAPDFTLSDAAGNLVHLADVLADHRLVVLVFYFSHTCDSCMQQLGELENDRAQFEQQDVQLVALAVQSIPGAALSVQKSGAQYPVLADSNHEVADMYAVLDLDPNASGRGLATPSVFVLDPTGRIVWLHVGRVYSERVSSQTILESLP